MLDRGVSPCQTAWQRNIWNAFESEKEKIIVTDGWSFITVFLYFWNSPDTRYNKVPWVTSSCYSTTTLRSSPRARLVYFYSVKLVHLFNKMVLLFESQKIKDLDQDAFTWTGVNFLLKRYLRRTVVIEHYYIVQWSNTWFEVKLKRINILLFHGLQLYFD